MDESKKAEIPFDKEVHVALAAVSRGPVRNRQHWLNPHTWFDSLPKVEQQRLMGLAVRECERATQAGVSIELPGCQGYPPGFSDLRNPPAVLYRLGASIPREPAVAVVGARAADGYGLAVTRRISHALAVRGAVIVSGGAKGVDQSAHGAALDVNGKTVVFLGSGLRFRQSADTTQLLDRILRNGGAVVSELPLDVPALKHHFPERNRLIAAAADVIVVIQAAARSGSLHTAYEACRLKRPVLAVPGDVCYRLNIGSNGLLTAGVAQTLCHPDDVLAALRRCGRPLIGPLQGCGEPWPEPGTRLETLPPSWRKTQSLPPQRSDDGLWASEMDPVLEFVDTEPRPAEEIAARARRPLPEVVAALSVLQLERRVLRVAGNRFVTASPLTSGKGCA
ncbi:MAG: DNA-protecting protein DprA [Myxococcales bacterium]|nr:DNA-protecting protein DprA [Myxococcales bacterium]